MYIGDRQATKSVNFLPASGSYGYSQQGTAISEQKEAFSEG